MPEHFALKLSFVAILVDFQITSKALKYVKFIIGEICKRINNSISSKKFYVF